MSSKLAKACFTLLFVGKRDLILPNVSLSRSSSRIANGACRPGFPFRNCLPPLEVGSGVFSLQFLD